MDSKKNGTKKIGPAKKKSKAQKRAEQQAHRQGIPVTTPPGKYRGKYWPR